MAQADDDSDLPGNDPPAPSPKPSKKKAAKATAPPAPPEDEKPEPLPEPEPQKPKHSARLLRLAESYGIEPGKVASLSSEELLDEIHDAQRVIEADHRARASVQPTPAAPKAEEPDPDLIDETEFDPRVAKAINKLLKENKELKAKAGEFEEREKARATTQIEGYIDDAFDALPEGFRAKFGEGPLTELKDDAQKNARFSLFRAAGIDVSKDNARAIKSKIAQTVKSLLGEPAPAKAAEPAEGAYAEAPKKKPGKTEQWAAAALSVPTSRNGAPELVKTQKQRENDVENAWRKRMGKPLLGPEHDDDDLPG